MLYKKKPRRDDTENDEKSTNDYHGGTIDRSAFPWEEGLTAPGPGGSSGDGLRLSGQPLQRLLPALPLQLCSDHLAALPVVLVHPVALRK